MKHVSLPDHDHDAKPTATANRKACETDRDLDGDGSLMSGIFASQATPSAPSPGEEATMPNISLMPFQKLDCYVVAKDLARLVHQAGIAHAVLKDQARRASVSCFLQLAEGLPNDGAGMRRKYFTESNNSLHETVAAIDLAESLGALDREVAAPIQGLAFRLKRMLRALLNGR